MQQITRLLQQNNLIEALDFALRQGDIAYVMHVCRSGDESELENNRVGQSVLCSLIQQLGLDLEQDLSIKLGWMHTALLNLDNQDPVTKQVLPSLLDGLSRSLDDALQSHADRSDPDHRMIKLMMGMVSNFQRR